MAATTTNYDAVLRELWPDQRVRNQTFQASAFLGLVPKSENFFEKTRHIAFKYGNPQGRSANFATAQGNAGNTSLGEFAVTRIKDYAVWQVDGDLIEDTRGNRAALLTALETESMGALDELANALSYDLWNTGTGSRGQVATSGITTTALTLADPNDVVNFEVGMELVGAATETGALRDSGNSATITGIDPDGVLTTDSNWTSQISGLTDDDFLFVEGDAPNGGANVKASGVPAWIPTADPAATAFFGLDRTTHVTRMSGVRGSQAGTIVETVKNLAAKIRLFGGKRAKPDMVFLNTVDLDNLDTELGTQRRYVNVKAQGADVGFDGIEFTTPAGRVTAVEDRYMPQGRVWLLQMNTWEWSSAGVTPRIIQDDGNKILRQATSDGIEGRAKYRGQLYCSAPAWNGTSAIPT